MKERQRLIETGHYYIAYGPTIWASTGVRIMEKFVQPGDKTMLFVDDVHGIACVSDYETSEPIVELNFAPDITILESKMVEPALKILDTLTSFENKKKRAKRDLKNGKWYVSGFPITDGDGYPLCVLLDTALTVHKYDLGFQHIQNILPKFYEAEQLNLIRILRKLELPNMIFSVTLFDKDGSCKRLEDYSTATEQTQEVA